MSKNSQIIGAEDDDFASEDESVCIMQKLLKYCFTFNFPEDYVVNHSTSLL